LELNYTAPLGGTGPTDNTEFYKEHPIRNNLMVTNHGFELRHVMLIKYYRLPFCRQKTSRFVTSLNNIMIIINTVSTTQFIRKTIFVPIKQLRVSTRFGSSSDL